MIEKNIKLQITTSELQYYSNQNDLDKNFFIINNNQENIISIYKNINYNIYFPILNINKFYYFILTKNHNLIEKIINYNTKNYNIICDLKSDKYSFKLQELNIYLNYNLLINNEENNY